MGVALAVFLAFEACGEDGRRNETATDVDVESANAEVGTNILEGDAPGAVVCDEERWIGAWAAAPGDAGRTIADQSLRLILTPSRGSDEARVRLSNRFGQEPVKFRNVHMGLQDDGPRLVAGSNRAVTFDGEGEVNVAPGEEVISDPVHLSFDAFERLAVSLFVPAPGGATQHAQGWQTSYLSASGSSDVSHDEGGDGYVETIWTRPFVVGVDVRAPGTESVVAAIGDSLTDGAQIDEDFNDVGHDTDSRYPDHLARRLREQSTSLSVINLGIGGNRLLSDGYIVEAGPSVLERLEADLLSRADVTDVVVLIGINDLALDPTLTAEELLVGLREAVRVMHNAEREQQLNVLVGTLMPAGGAIGPLSLAYPQTEERRQAVNAAIRAGEIGDSFVDFERAVRDPDDPSRLAPEYDGGDGLHLSPTGYARMAAEIDIAALHGRACD